ncbi:hypothetical protein [Vibrio sp. CAU 1672]|uniref:hypothetical protein n=1 Tax=Vibrio sp. CAU 1672 TaxID=3032594 RepID=UPI0023DCA9B1|nr:hypothetical protein [Vibrio sp. CAU 1672]MDF2155755.1 hypothetical protein [Vibrio sp. CAU 1672]
MLKLIAVALICLGVFIGVQYSEEIKSVVNEGSVEQLKQGFDKIADTVEKLIN